MFRITSFNFTVTEEILSVQFQFQKILILTATVSTYRNGLNAKMHLSNLYRKNFTT